MIISVTKVYIKIGVRGNPFKDPISLAVSSALGCKSTITGWGYCTCTYYDKKQNYRIDPVEVVEEFLRAWDSNQIVEPIVVTLTLEKESSTLNTTGSFRPRRYKTYSQEFGEKKPV